MDDGYQLSSFVNASSTSDSSSFTFSGVDVGQDLSSTVIFSSDFKQFDDLKKLLNSNKDAMKLEAMKRIVGMIARGKDCSDLFPSVVNNIVSSNAEICKLVHAFVARYARENEQLALLPISTLQRAFKNPNPRSRSSALRLLTSIRLPILRPLAIMAIKEAVHDLSPHVRRDAGHALVNLYSQQTDLEDDLDVSLLIGRLMGDSKSLVVSSGIQAYATLCFPQRIDLLHPLYRSLCRRLLDLDEWSQCVALRVLTHYARTQFTDPALSVDPNEEMDQPSNGFDQVNDSEVNGSGDIPLFSSDFTTTPSRRSLSSCSPSVNGDSSSCKKQSSKSHLAVKQMLTTDLDSLLSVGRFLLHNRNSGVVMAASQMLIHLHSKADYANVVRALVRLSRGEREVQSVVLHTIVSLTSSSSSTSISHLRTLFQSHLSTFYVLATDPLPVKLLKLEVLTNLINESNSPVVLREFQYYVTAPEIDFVCATIQSIGRCAVAIPSIGDVCLSGLVRLMPRSDERLVAECVVVLRKLLQTQSTGQKEIITSIADLVDTMTVPMALASILWLIGEYSQRVPKLAPDVLRKMAATFIRQDTVVRLQIVNLAAKLTIANPQQTQLLAQYVFAMALYDQDYDIRDRSRLFRALLFPKVKVDGDNDSLLNEQVREIFLTRLPAPLIQSTFRQDRSDLLVGTLSHLIQRRLPSYSDLPEWPLEAPNPWARSPRSPSDKVDFVGQQQQDGDDCRSDDLSSPYRQTPTSSYSHNSTGHESIDGDGGFGSKNNKSWATDMTLDEFLASSCSEEEEDQTVEGEQQQKEQPNSTTFDWLHAQLSSSASESSDVDDNLSDHLKVDPVIPQLPSLITDAPPEVPSLITDSSPQLPGPINDSSSSSSPPLHSPQFYYQAGASAPPPPLPSLNFDDGAILSNNSYSPIDGSEVGSLLSTTSTNHINGGSLSCELSTNSVATQDDGDGATIHASNHHHQTTT